MALKPPFPDRVREKQASRDRDAARLASGEVTREQLKRENSPFHGMGIKDWRIVEVGGRPVGGAMRDEERDSDGPGPDTIERKA